MVEVGLQGNIVGPVQIGFLQVYCNLENGSRSLMVSLKLGVQGIHVWLKLGDCSSKVKKVADFIGVHSKCCIVTLKMCHGHV